MDQIEGADMGPYQSPGATVIRGLAHWDPNNFARVTSSGRGSGQRDKSKLISLLADALRSSTDNRVENRLIEPDER